MNISIVTVYEPITNLGSFLQCYALKLYLEELGHRVVVVENVSIWKSIKSKLFTLNPKRALLLRWLKCYYTYKDIKRLEIVNKEKWIPSDSDCVIYGSDEIWNLHNPYFRDELFWGIGVDIPKIGYAISCGHMTEDEFRGFPRCQEAVTEFRVVYTRDNRTKELLKSNINVFDGLVCDPTFLVPLSQLTKEIKLPDKRYLLVYTYGLSNEHISYVKRFASENNLLIVSPCFWHIWADRVIECSALQFSSLIQGAEYVFTTTFHGAVFTMLNHKRCAIYAQREKVKELVAGCGVQRLLIDDDTDYLAFSEIIKSAFPTITFESSLEKQRNQSKKLLNNTLNQIKLWAE